MSSHPEFDAFLERALEDPETRAAYEAAQHTAELEAAIDRVRYLHGQRSENGLAPGKWCPSCGHPVPCPTIRALNGNKS